MKNFFIAIGVLGLFAFYTPSFGQCPTGNVTGDRTISSNCTISSSLTITGNLTLSNSATLTINSGVVVTVNGILQSSYQGGAITINGGGTINVGGRFYNQVRTSTSFTFSNVTVSVNNTSSTTVQNNYRSVLNLTNGTTFTVVQGDFENDNETVMNINNSTFNITSGDFLNDFKADLNLTNGGNFNINNGDMQTENESLFLIDASDAYVNGDMNNDFRADLIVQNGGTLTVTGDFNNGLQPNGNSANEGSVSVDGGSISIGGDLNNTYGSDITVDGGGNFAVAGDVDNAQAATISVPDGTFSYGGTLTDPHSGVSSSSDDSECTDGCCGSGCDALPVSLTYFEATKSLSGVDLVWKTASETNNDFFTLERSFNGVDFIEVREVGGAGDSKDEKIYRCNDQIGSNSIVYYRLSQTDFDGTHVLLRVVSVGSTPQSSVTLVPNVLYANRHVRADGATADMSWKIVSLSGQLIRCGSFIQGNQLILDDLDKGIYLFQVAYPNQRQSAQRFVVK